MIRLLTFWAVQNHPAFPAACRISQVCPEKGVTQPAAMLIQVRPLSMRLDWAASQGSCVNMAPVDSELAYSTEQHQAAPMLPQGNYQVMVAGEKPPSRTKKPPQPR